MTIATGEQALAADVIDGANMPSGSIIIWSGTIANIPSGWLICDGNNGTPNLLGRFVEGVATAGTNPGTIGGSTSKSTPGHAHLLNQSRSGATGSFLYTSDPVYPTLSWGSIYLASSIYSTDTQSPAISDIRPLYYDAAFIMKS